VFDIEPRCREVEVRVEKPGALRHARSVGITIHRSRVTST
jgi:dihydroneopterin aldolase